MAPPNRAQLELFFKDKYATYTTKYEEQFTSFPQLPNRFFPCFSYQKNNLQYALAESSHDAGGAIPEGTALARGITPACLT